MSAVVHGERGGVALCNHRIKVADTGSEVTCKRCLQWIPNPAAATSKEDEDRRTALDVARGILDAVELLVPIAAEAGSPLLGQVRYLLEQTAGKLGRLVELELELDGEHSPAVMRALEKATGRPVSSSPGEVSR